MEIKNLGNNAFANYILQFENGSILIDAGYATNFNKFQRKLEKNNIDIKDIKYMFLTHVHNDHISYLKELAEKTDIMLIMNKKAKDRLLRGSNVLGDATSKISKIFSILTKLTGQSTKKFPSIDVSNNTIFVDNNSKFFKDNGFPLSIITLEGHTPDSIGLVTDTGEIFCGDACINNFPAKKRQTLLIEDLEKYKDSWKKMINLNARIIYPGHGKPFLANDLLKFKNDLNEMKLYKNK